MKRREFVVGSAATLVVLAAGGSYLTSGCPLDSAGAGVCTGPCAAFIDLNGDGECDRVPVPVVAGAASATGAAEAAAKVAGASLTRACPFGLRDDPYPGECHLYVDADGDGICDLSRGEPAAVEGEAAEPARRPRLARQARRPARF